MYFRLFTYFLGPFDTVMREGTSGEIIEAMNQLSRVASERGIPIGRVVGPSPGYGNSIYSFLMEMPVF